MGNDYYVNILQIIPVFILKVFEVYPFGLSPAHYKYSVPFKPRGGSAFIVMHTRN